MMVFGNTGDRSATGVGFTRNPATGAKEFYGEFLINAQGEDVVAGIRTPQPIRELEKVMPKAYKQLREITTRLEKHYTGRAGLRVHIQDERSSCCRRAAASAPATRPSSLPPTW
jgi:pyruvate,orthophosphate dikinase